MDSYNKNLASTVETTQRTYRVLVGYNTIENLGVELSNLGAEGRLFLISDNSIFPEFILKIHHVLEKSNYKTNILAFDFNETNKNNSTLQKLYDWYGEQRIERNDTIIAVGGGVVERAEFNINALLVEGIISLLVNSSNSLILEDPSLISVIFILYISLSYFLL